MRKFRIDKIIERYFKNESTASESRFVKAYLRYLEKGFNKPAITDDEKSLIKDEIKNRIWSNIEGTDDLVKTRKAKTRKIYRYAAAASVLLGLTFTYYSFQKTNSESSLQLGDEIAAASYSPIENSALLVLEDGSIIDLNKEKEGFIKGHNHQQISKRLISKEEEGLLSYQLQNDEVSKTPRSTPSQLLTNTIIVPKGGTYRINLADGSKVWLNSDTKLIFPAEFADHERRVELIGEAYFEIAKNRNKPFFVTTNLGEIEVLGTHFNVSAYENEGLLKTTLIEGKVKVGNGEENAFLFPGEQVEVVKGKSFVKKKVTSEEAVAWKDGYFYFKNNSIEQIMRAIARTYNVEVTYKGDFKKLNFGGKISIHRSLESVLDIIELTGNVNFKIEGRRVLVMN